MSKPAMTSVVSERLLAILQSIQRLPVLVWYRGLCIGLSLVLVYTLSLWLWLLLPQAEPTAGPAVVTGAGLAQQSSQHIDIEKLQSYNLFGAMQAGAEQQPAELVQPEQTVNAEPTRLKLQLNGVVLASNPDDALAMIVYQGKEDQYAIGDRLPVARVVLSQIYRDHVIIENAGRYESLWLFEGDKDSSPSSPSPSQPEQQVDKRNNQQVSSMAREYRQRLYKNPSSLADALRITPYQVDGVMYGYRINPGRDKQQFKQLGLKSNDVVTSINGIRLNDPAKAVELYKIMRSAKQATFIIERDGQPVEMLVSLENE
ncbi:type II secretion system protein GspC [Dasania sp. GY-MA-18]|uniref:Type II secretion system protein GspC n=1 Tax=Dasania phycosphaerae TaxID=2950436 RepID=A0A9J6RMC6_9GAMM|nr:MULTISPECIES: type II secretion system protein GspC [Dasania]MCR8923235.1 type II secretion system protein GspC [Dasania sp. GY-MA-18]MCZ0865667.1 type II secretion system protein GspC [Dasania phycosphaerae]MCZ0869392.1 type II secretion system protein GspC [Dasania phycosphaerae]